MKRKTYARSHGRNVHLDPSRSGVWYAVCICLFSALIFPSGASAQDENGQAQSNQITSETTVPAQGGTNDQADDQGDDQGNNKGNNKGSRQPTAAEMVTDYLRQDIFVRPGVGLKKVKIGMPFDQVLKAWGPPTSKAGTVDNQWTYQVGSNTKITLFGDNKVKVMKIAGGFNTPYVTTEGASFGMPQYQLATIYGSAKEVTGKIVYNHRGIGFVMDRGQVSEIQVFAPR